MRKKRKRETTRKGENRREKFGNERENRTTKSGERKKERD